MALETQLLETFATNHPVQLARALESLTAEESGQIIESLPFSVSSDLLRWLPALFAAQMLSKASSHKAAEVLSHGRLDVAAAVMRVMTAEARTQIESLVDPAKRDAVARLVRYPERSAGALMDPEVLSLAESTTVEEAMARVRNDPAHVLYYLYIVSEDQRLSGVLSLRELMMARPSQGLASIATQPVLSVSARASWESILAHPGWKQVHALPVVEAGGRFAGVLRYESVRKLEQVASEAHVGHAAAQTGLALGELYGLGLRGFLQWASALVQGQGPEQGS